MIGTLFHFNEGIFEGLILKIVTNIEIGHLQQLDRLLQLRCHDKRLLLLDLERWHHLHFVLPCLHRLGTDCEDDAQHRKQWQNIYLTRQFVSFQTKLMFINNKLMKWYSCRPEPLSINRREIRAASAYSGMAFEYGPGQHFGRTTT